LGSPESVAPLEAYLKRLLLRGSPGRPKKKVALAQGGG
jgi:hypothetical protein